MITQADPTYKVAFSQFALREKIPDGSPLWSEFTGSFRNEELPLSQIANRIYAGHAICTQHHGDWKPPRQQQRPGNWRHGDNYICGQHVGLDFDGKIPGTRCSLEALAADNFIAKYGGLLYTTPSHTPDQPRTRALFTLDQPIMQARNYSLAATALIWLFGGADPQCKDPCRFFFGSLGCEVVYLDGILPLATLKHVIEQYKASGTVARRAHAAGLTPAPDEAEVYAALKLIPAWGIEYEEWVAVLMAVHAGLGDPGLRLAEEWAQEGYRGEVEKKWRGFKQKEGGVGLATLFAIAKRYGWHKAH